MEFPDFFDLATSQYNKIYLIANSIGAYYSMLSLADKSIEEAMFISPIVDMEKVILNMMAQSNISEANLRKRKEITTSSGTHLSWRYLSHARNNSIIWNIPTHILYAENDNITSLETMMNFANKIGATVTIMNHGEHWFHTEEQMNFLDNWFRKFI